MDGTLRLMTTARVRGVTTPLNAAAGYVTAATDSAVVTIGSGVGSGYGTLYVAREYALGAGASATFDLYAGTDLPGADGVTAPFRTLRAYAVWVKSGGDTAGVTVAGGASNPHTLFFTGTTPGQTVYPDGPPATGGSPAGVAVTSTAKNVKLTNNGAVAVVVSVWLAGSDQVTGAAGGPLGLVYA